jgi:hypothetical protein
VGVQEQASACSLRGLVPRPSGTAVYYASGAVAPRKIREACPHGRRNEVKPVRTVVWDPWLALAVSHGDPIRLLYDAIGATSRLILSPIDLWATSRSCSDCSPIQNPADVPKNFARRNAVSADKLLLHFVISVRREGGIPVERDTDARLSPIGLINSSSKISPG